MKRSGSRKKTLRVRKMRTAHLLNRRKCRMGRRLKEEAELEDVVELRGAAVPLLATWCQYCSAVMIACWRSPEAALGGGP